MVKVLIGDLFSSSAQTLVNTVNCVGVMGKGIALECKKRFPDMYVDYEGRCQRGEVRLGRPYLYRRMYEPWILNFPTKDHWRSVSRLADIEEGLNYLEKHYREWAIESLAVPPLGCGNGQLDWRVVGPTLYRHLNRLDIPVELYAPFGTPEEQLAPSYLAAREVPASELQRYGSATEVEPGWFALVALLRRIEIEPYRHPIGRTVFQKLAYFATEVGISTNLSYRKASYGPFAPGLKKVVARLENNGLLREERRGRMFLVHTGPAYGDALHLFRPALQEWRAQLASVSDLFLRMDTRQAELAATVHYAAHHLLNGREGISENDVVCAVMEWKQNRKPPLDYTDVAVTVRNLNMLRWLDVAFSPDLISEDVYESEFL